VGLFKRKRRRGAERGAAAVEFALVVPMLVTLVFGMVDAGWAINRYSVLNNAVREGARTASLGGDSATSTSAVTTALDTSMIQGTPTITVTCTKSTGVSATCGTPETSGGTATVTARVTQSWLTPVMATLVPGGVKLSKEMKMRIE
jgi:Flp pilus assembly protein TadG